MYAVFTKHRKTILRGLVALALAACAALAWIIAHAPERARHPLAAAMESQSASYFAAEQDLAGMLQAVRDGRIAAVGLSPRYALVAGRDGSRAYVRLDAERSLAAELLREGLAGRAEVIALESVHPPGPPLAGVGRRIDAAWLALLVPLALVGALLYALNPARGSGAFKAAARPATRFDDVVGVAEAKEALQDIVAYLRRPAKFAAMGARPPRGVVLEGHTGCGKTLLARAVAGEAGVAFIALSGSDFTDMFLGVGVRRVKKLFAAARAQAPCVVFIDEIDGLGRRSAGASAGETENNRIINALLVELDGFATGSGIVVLGATNNVDHLDPALVRAGRFDRICHLGLPDVDERERLFALHARGIRTAGPLDLRPLARLASGLPPASIASVVNAAALLAAKEDAPATSQMHLQRALERELMGGTIAGQTAPDAAERNRIAVHEAGHAIVARVLGVGVVEKVSILGRGGALGATLVTNDQDARLQSEAQLRARIAMLLGGRAAERLVLRDASTGAANDLERASNLAYRMVTEFGLGGQSAPFSYAGLPERDRALARCADAIAEARTLISAIDAECTALLRERRRALEALAARLLEHETVGGPVVDECLAAA